MSDAPRKIWLAVSMRGDMSCDSRGGKLQGHDRHERYHHDAVVRELVDAADALVKRWDSPAWGGSSENLRHTGEYIADLRAALAKIAQEPAP